MIYARGVRRCPFGLRGRRTEGTARRQRRLRSSIRPGVVGLPWQSSTVLGLYAAAQGTPSEELPDGTRTWSIL